MAIGLLLGLAHFSQAGLAGQHPAAPVLPEALSGSASVFTMVPGAGINASAFISVKYDMAQNKEYFQVGEHLKANIGVDAYIDFTTQTVDVVVSVPFGHPVRCLRYANLTLEPKSPNIINSSCPFGGAAFFQGMPANQWNCDYAISAGFSDGLAVSIMSSGNTIMGETLFVPATQKDPAYVSFITFDQFIPLPSLPTSVFTPPSLCSAKAVQMPGSFSILSLFKLFLHPSSSNFLLKLDE